MDDSYAPRDYHVVWKNKTTLYLRGLYIFSETITHG